MLRTRVFCARGGGELEGSKSLMTAVAHGGICLVLQASQQSQ